jgi:lipid II:glycine glycyltransferase (peptidoglycan interpeptide bridge formation enzyme)
VCAALAQLTEHRLAVLFVQPPPGANQVGHALRRLDFRPSTAGIAPAASLELDLSRPVDALRRGLRSGTRGNIRQAASRGVAVRMATEGDLPVVADLLSATAAHHRFPPVPLSHLRTLYRQLEPAGHLKIFLAEHAGVPVATQVLTSCGEVAKLRLTGLRRTTPAANGAAALLQWETILWAKENGHRLFDFGGIAVSAVAAVQAGPAGLADRVSGRDYFKASFGGRAVRFPQAVERFSGPAVRIGYDLAQRSNLGRHAIHSARQFLRAGRTTR